MLPTALEWSHLSDTFPSSQPVMEDLSERTTESGSGADTKAGYVTLVGPPNVGKSTLLNALLGTKLSIVTEKEQTTWQRITGIETRGGVQAIFLDTPGILDPRDLLQSSMLHAADTALREADVLLIVLDASTTTGTEAVRSRMASVIRVSRAPRVVALNKCDVASTTSVGEWERWAETALDATEVRRVSALTGEGIEALGEAVRAHVPPGPFLYPPEDIATEPVRFFVAELIRETIFQRYRQEIPYSVFAQIDEYRASQSPVYIGATIYVERNSQKGILVGKGGSSIRELGKEAREKIEDFIGEKVYLDLWVKVLPGWRRKKDHLKRLGFKVPTDHEAAKTL